MKYDLKSYVRCKICDAKTGKQIVLFITRLKVLDISFGTSPVSVPNSTPSSEKAKSNSNGKSESIIIYPNDKTYYFIAKQ